MTAIALSAATSEAAIDALFHALSSHAVAMPADGRVLFLRAREGRWWSGHSRSGWTFQQGFKPFADGLERAGHRVAEPADDERFPLVLVLPPRQRDEARALFARAVRHASDGGVVLAAIANTEGARSGESDLARLAGGVEVMSKHKCRIFWTAPLGGDVDAALLSAWSALDAPRTIADGYASRPGLFAWDRVDAASKLLVDHLPATLAGHAADLGAGYGYLSAQLVARCAGITAIDLYEAEARALGPARDNLARAVAASGREVAVDVLWHDVTAGLPRRYDVIVSNPPFHQGRADQPGLGQAFIAAAARALTPRGVLWLVANRHLPYEVSLAERFTEVREVAVEHGFKVFEARGVRA